jgi:thioesterase domain-containing protein
MDFASYFNEPDLLGIVNGMDASAPIIFLSGAGGGTPDLNVFLEGGHDATRFEVISYPDWRRCIADDFSAEVLIEQLATQIMTKVPQGPIRIIGLSIGGHLGYAIGVHLQAMGREIAGLCAIDSFMFASSGPLPGWKGRALEQGFELLRQRRILEFASFLRFKFWRALVRLAGSRLPGLLKAFPFSSRSSSVLAIDPVFDKELSMRLLIRTVAPWMVSLDREPVALKAPAILLRTAVTAGDDAAWRRRCSSLQIFEIEGQHHNLFEPENVGSLRDAFFTGTRGWR